MQCPNCGLFNPDSAQRCDCGYDFQSKKMVVVNKATSRSKPNVVAQWNGNAYIWGIIAVIIIFALFYHRISCNSITHGIPEIQITGLAAEFVEFKNWQSTSFGIKGEMTFIGPLSPSSIRWSAYSSENVKLSDGSILSPSLSKGETGKVEIVCGGDEDVSRIVIEVN
jgi:hypothetical protein